jgi:hypothetical protein
MLFQIFHDVRINYTLCSIGNYLILMLCLLFRLQRYEKYTTYANEKRFFWCKDGQQSCSLEDARYTRYSLEFKGKDTRISFGKMNKQSQRKVVVARY